MLNKTGNIQSREYTETIECYATIKSSDDYGMQTVVIGDSIGNFDAKVTQMSQYKKQLYFKDASVTGVEIVMRYIDTVPGAVAWNNHNIIITGVENVDNRNRQLILRGSYMEDGV